MTKTKHSALISAFSIVAPIENWDDETIDDFVDELRIIGIIDAETFERLYSYSTSDYRPFYDFAWYLYYDAHDLGDELMALKGLVIDWQATWDCYLSSRYEYFRFENEVYFFKKGYITDQVP